MLNEAGANQMRRGGCQAEAQVGRGGAYYDDSYVEKWTLEIRSVK